MADPICRWRNASIKQLMEFNSLLPLNVIQKKNGREHVETLWRILGGEDFFTTPYQLAAQMGTYYEDNEYLYPRFDNFLSIEEAANYMYTWGENYYSPNPYAKSIKNVRPVVINKFLVNYAQTELNPTFTGALQEMFGDNAIGNTDILKNMLNTFSQVNVSREDIVTVKPIAQGKFYTEEEIYPSVDADDKKAFFEHFGKVQGLNLGFANSNLPLQQIFYGAPGTGKSHTIDEKTNESNRIRTTFHPDYDYATFVGAYKPTVKTVDKYGLFGKDTVAMKHEDNTPITEEVIVYKFIPQTFIKAYVEAWRRYTNAERTDKDFYLVIEEINRGNCAQIFGDLLQLLDRTNAGFSSYAVETDTDLQTFLTTDEEYKLDIVLTEDIKNDNGKVIATAENVMNGKVLVLPPNLHIWATMNTSDQSLFPIDSAFKRRWDWKYVPIKYANTNWNVKLKDGTWCKWTDLQQILNDLIYDATESEDKMLGDWFVKADSKNEINEEQLVGKIIFYLWNDVAKVDAGKLFDHEIEKNGRKRKVIFSDFYKIDGEVNHDIIKEWLKNIKVLKNKPIEDENPNDPEQ